MPGQSETAERVRQCMIRKFPVKVIHAGRMPRRGEGKQQQEVPSKGTRRGRRKPDAPRRYDVPRVAQDFLTLVKKGKKNSVKRLLQELPKTDIHFRDSLGRTPLWHACANGHVEVLRLLVEAGAHIADADLSHWTGLHVACDAGHANIVEFFMAHVDGRRIVNFKTAGPLWTALHFAAMAGNAGLCNLLLQNGRASVNELTKDGWSALHFASNGGHREAVFQICNAGADVNYADPQNQETALHMACREGHRKTAELFLERGARVSLLDANGTTPIAAAVLHGFPWKVHCSW